MQEVRWELDRNGFEHVKIFASGGIDVEYILHLNPVCDAYGVGGAIADAPMIDYSLDIVEVAGEDRSKRGKRGGRKRLLELKDSTHRVIPTGAPVPEGARDLLRPIDRKSTRLNSSHANISYAVFCLKKKKKKLKPTI